jgi:gluconokinase
MIVVVAGVAGSGKSTVGKLLAGRLGWGFADADAFHPAANVAKMRAGVPLTDADRQPWLAAIGAWIDDRVATGQPAVVTCSALKRAYRDALLDGRDRVAMVFLVITEAQDEERVTTRSGHFFPERLVASQFAELELPAPDERVTDVAAGRPAAQLVDEIIEKLGLRLRPS